MTPEEKGKWIKFLRQPCDHLPEPGDLVHVAPRTVVNHLTHAKMVCEEWALAAIAAAVAGEYRKWISATEHPSTCGYVNGPKPPCTCGAHARLAELHSEAARAIRAR